MCFGGPIFDIFFPVKEMIKSDIERCFVNGVKIRPRIFTAGSKTFFYLIIRSVKSRY